MQQAALPYSIRASKTIWLIQRGDVGPRPMCFPSDDAWREHLMYQHASGEQITRRQDTGTYRDYQRQTRSVRTVFDSADYCQDCDIGGEYQSRMDRAGRCANTLKPKAQLMLKTLHAIVSELATVAKSPQISIVPNSTGGMSIIAAWGVDDDVHELAMHYTAKEIDVATGEQVAESLARLAAEARESAVASMVNDMTPAEMQSRLLMAARRAPKHEAVDLLAKIAQGARP